MAYCEANGHPVAEGTITIPLVGLAIAELLVDVGTDEGDAIAAGDSVSLELGEGAKPMTMTARRVGDDGGRSRVLLVAGAGKLAQPVKPKFFDAPTASLVLKDTLQEVGEAPGALELPGSLPAWVRFGGPAYEAIRSLMLEFPGYVWNVGTDGKVWAGKVQWPQGSEVSIIRHDPARDRWELEAAAELRPGVTLEEVGRVGRVVHTIGPKLRTEVWSQ